VIEAELASHGIGRGAAAALLEGENWDERARAVLVRRVRGEAADAAVRRKLATWLERRGYPAGAIRFALGALGRGEVDNPA
jgi:SOS response regulatory protein OraA/RecX